MDFPLSPVKKILKRTHMRIGKDAVKELTILLEEITADIAAEATRIAKANKRKTVSAEDVRVARKKLI